MCEYVLSVKQKGKKCLVAHIDHESILFLDEFSRVRISFFKVYDRCKILHGGFIELVRSKDEAVEALPNHGQTVLGIYAAEVCCGEINALDRFFVIFNCLDVFGNLFILVALHPSIFSLCFVASYKIRIKDLGVPVFHGAGDEEFVVEK